MPSNHAWLGVVSIVTLVVMIATIVPPAHTLAAAQQEPQKTEPVRVRELIDQRTVNTKAFLNDDGSTTVEVFNGPAHVKDQSGKWVDRGLQAQEEREPFSCGKRRGPPRFQGIIGWAVRLGQW